MSDSQSRPQANDQCHWFAPSLGIALWKQFYRDRWFGQEAPHTEPRRLAYNPKCPDDSATDRYFKQLDNMQWRNIPALKETP